MGSAFFGCKFQRPLTGLGEVAVQYSGFAGRNDIDRPRYRECSNRHATGHCFEQDKPESIRCARKYKDIGAGEVAGKVRTELVTDKLAVRVLSSQAFAVRSVADNNFRPR